ncbi:ROK family protein [Alicyclobacillaceae bacterium I2511]|nr:ROK family protein [Alicyclobacillaceae bacterium I2511]
MTVFFAVDVGGTSTKTALIDDKGTILDKQSFKTWRHIPLEDFNQGMVQALLDGMNAVGLQRRDIRGAGIGIAGFLDLNRGTVVEAINVGWNDVPFIALAQAALAMPVTIDNDANVAALGEAWIGAGSGARTALCVTVGTGIGGGIVMDGQLYRGVNGMAGEIGHLVVQRENGFLCNCGMHGCLETLASATAMVRLARAVQQRGEIPLDIVIDGAKVVVELAQQGNLAAQGVVREVAHWLGYGLSLAANTLNPDVIVIGGGVSTAGEIFLGPVRTAFLETALGRVAEAVEIRAAALGNDAGVVGAAALAAQRLE